LAQNASAAYPVLCGTGWIHCDVNQTIGGIAKIPVSRIAGGMPTPNNAIAGSG